MARERRLGLFHASLPFAASFFSIVVLASHSSPRSTVLRCWATNPRDWKKSLALSLAEKGIRVNGVAPGPIWTPLIPATFPAKDVATFGSDTPLGRAGEPEDVATSFVFLASDDSSYMTGQVLHPTGGRVVNG